MKEFQLAYIPVGVPTFHLESAQEEFEKSKKLLKGLCPESILPEKMLLSIPDLIQFLDRIQPDLIVLQNITFANAAYASEVLKRFKCPVLLWTLREPVIDGGRLRLNSLTGAYSAGNVLMAMRDGNFEYIYGSPDEERVNKKLTGVIAAAKLKYELQQLKIAAIGHTPQGFGFGRALDTEMLQVFGADLLSVEARELIERAKNYENEEITEPLGEIRNSVQGTDTMPHENIEGAARLLKAYKEYVNENNIGALASRCWPDFFTSYGTPVCSVLGLLNDLGIAASCEADIYGALSMYMGMQLTKEAVFFGDPVSLDEEENTITFWHCGMAPATLAHSDTKALAGVHPNRKIGPVMEFGCKPCEKVTLFRVGRKVDGSFRFFTLTGEALDKPRQFCGTSVVVKTDILAEEVVARSVQEGWEPHFVVIYGDVKEELEILGRMLGIEVCNYN